MEPTDIGVLTARVNSLVQGMGNLATAIVTSGTELSAKADRLDVAISTTVGLVSAKIDQLSKAVDRASTASDRHARSLVVATWVLAGSTGVLAALTAILVYVTWVKP